MSNFTLSIVLGKIDRVGPLHGGSIEVLFGIGLAFLVYIYTKFSIRAWRCIGHCSDLGRRTVVSPGMNFAALAGLVRSWQLRALALLSLGCATWGALVETPLEHSSGR